MSKNITVIVGLVLVSVALHAQGWYAQTSGTNALLMDVKNRDSANFSVKFSITISQKS
jgi:hypothetical protein